jgi:hypothetical protein
MGLPDDVVDSVCLGAFSPMAATEDVVNMCNAMGIETGGPSRAGSGPSTGQCPVKRDEEIGLRPFPLLPGDGCRLAGRVDCHRDPVGLHRPRPGS